MKTAIPQNIEAELSVIATCVWVDGAAQKAVELINPCDFYNKDAATAFEAITALVRSKTAIDVATIFDAANDKTIASFLARVIESSPAGDIEHYSQVVLNNSLLRQMIAKAQEVIVDCRTSNDAATTLDTAHKEILSVKPSGTVSEVSSMSQMILSCIKNYDAVSLSGEKPGIMTGFRKLDELLGGFQNSDLIIIAARPSMGKTALSEQITINVQSCNRRKIPVLFFSHEMSKEQLVQRAIASEANINLHKIRTGRLDPYEKQRFDESAAYLAGLPIFIDDRPGLKVAEVARTARQMKQKHDIGLIVFDYLQLAKGGTSESRNQEVSDISRGFKAIAKELDIPFVALSQLNRDLEKRGDKRPIMADLRDSGAIEQDADVIMFVYRDEVYNKDENNPNKGCAEILVSKQRNGPVGMVKLSFQAASAKFADLAYDANFNGKRE